MSKKYVIGDKVVLTKGCGLPNCGCRVVGDTATIESVRTGMYIIRMDKDNITWSVLPNSFKRAKRYWEK